MFQRLHHKLLRSPDLIDTLLTTKPNTCSVTITASQTLHKHTEKQEVERSSPDFLLSGLACWAATWLSTVTVTALVVWRQRACTCRLGIATSRWPSSCSPRLCSEWQHDQEIQDRELIDNV